MRIPVIHGVIDRRILVNFRIDPDVLSTILPSPFRPQLVDGWGVAGICLIRLKQIRPRRLPFMPGMTSENAAHRIAVEWDSDGETRTGVFIPRRDTSLLLNVLAGGRVFPGIHHYARFDVRKEADRFHVAMESRDGSTHVRVDGRIHSRLPVDSVFSSVKSASEFFESGSLGYSPSATSYEYDGMELRTLNWHVDALSIDSVTSSFFENRSTFPAGSVNFDCALLMRNIDHEWHSRETLHGSGSTSHPAEYRS